MADGAVDMRKVFAKPLIKQADMSAEMQAETMDVISMAVDKYVSSRNFEAACRLIKETMEKKYGPSWHVCMGEGFSYQVTYQQRNLMYMYHGERIGVLVFKC